MSALGDYYRSKAQPTATVEVPEPSILWGGATTTVQDSKDLRRIVALPRRPPPQPSEEDIQKLVLKLRRPGGTRSLRPIQAAALLEAQEVGGLFGMIGVGAGKTDISVLLPTVLNSQRAVLLVPSSLRDKLLKVEYPYLATQWRLPNLHGHPVVYPDAPGMLYVLSYDQLSRKSGMDALERINPDLIILDEAHKVARDSTRTKRFRRFMKAHPNARLCALSGTMTKDSIKDFADLLRFSLKGGAPIPFDFRQLEAWAAALDVVRFRPPPGALEVFMRPDETDPRPGYNRRLVETPGVVATTTNRIGASLSVHTREVKVPKVVKEALAQLRSEWTLPGGEPFDDALSFYRGARQIAAGLYLKWTYPRNEPLEVRVEWLEARKEYNREVRQMLKGDARPGLDSPDLIKHALISGNLKRPALVSAWERWQRVEKEVVPVTVPVWLDSFLVDDAVEWGKKHQGIIWYEHDALGREIAEKGGFSFYGPSSESGTKDEVPPIVRESGHRSIVASIEAWSTGWNLQQFEEQLFTTPPSNATDWEQAMGRSHREGTTADEVEAYVYLHTPELEKSLTDAIEDAKYQQTVTGSDQKLLYCTFSSVVYSRT